MSRIERSGEILGFGRYTTVYAGWDSLVERQVAIRVLQPGAAANDAFVRAFLGRAAQMLDVVDEHVLATYSIDHGQQPAAVVREVADQTLETTLLSAPVGIPRAEAILRQGLAGLDALHSRGMVHGGVKPQNLFWVGETCKVGDFGLLSLPAGVPPEPGRDRRYTAPEVVRGDGCTAAVDVYALGLVIYELLLGSPRFEKLAAERAREAHAGGEADARLASGDALWPAFQGSALDLAPLHELLAGFPVALSLTVRQMTCKDASARFADAGQVLTSLGPTSAPAASAGGGHRPRAEPEKAAERSGRPAAGLAKQILVAAGAAALLVCLGWLLARKDRVDPIPTICPAAGVASATSAAGLGTALRSLSWADSSFSFDLERSAGIEPSAGGGTPTVPLGTPVRFRVASGHPGHLLVFELNADGDLTCLYPNLRRPDLPVDGGPGGLVVPVPEDERTFSWQASKPPGLDLVFAVRFEQAMSLPEAAGAGPPEQWKRVYPWHGAGGENAAPPAKVFAEWVAQMRCAHPREVAMAVRDLAVVDR